jgi:hypothetical protein
VTVWKKLNLYFVTIIDVAGIVQIMGQLMCLFTFVVGSKDVKGSFLPIYEEVDVMGVIIVVVVMMVLVVGGLVGGGHAMSVPWAGWRGGKMVCWKVVMGTKLGAASMVGTKQEVMGVVTAQE